MTANGTAHSSASIALPVSYVPEGFDQSVVVDVVDVRGGNLLANAFLLHSKLTDILYLCVHS